MYLFCYLIRFLRTYRNLKKNDCLLCTFLKKSCLHMLVFQILMNARMEVTCVATLRYVRTQWEVMVVFAPEVTDLRE